MVINNQPYFNVGKTMLFLPPMTQWLGMVTVPHKNGDLELFIIVFITVYPSYKWDK